MGPFFSVCIPTYNRATFILEAINSVLSQTFKNFEIVVYDDGSTDNTEQVVSGFKDNRIKYFKGKVNKGRPFARNKCIQLSRGSWIVWLDDDDIMDKYLLELYREAIENFKEVEIFYLGKLKIVDLKGNRGIASVEDYYSYDSKLVNLILERSPIPNPASCVKKSVYSRFGMYDLEFERAEDYEFWARIFPEVQRKAIDYVGLMYRTHQQQASGMAFLLDTSYESLVKRRFIKKFLNYFKFSEESLYKLSRELNKVGDFFNSSYYLWLLGKTEEAIYGLEKSGILKGKETSYLSLMKKYLRLISYSPSSAIYMGEKLGLSYSYLALALSLKQAEDNSWKRVYAKAFVINPFMYLPGKVEFIPLSASRIVRVENNLEKEKEQFLNWVRDLGGEV